MSRCCIYQLVSGELWVAVGQFSGLEHWESVASNVIITPPAPGTEDAVEVLDPETGITRYMQPHIKEYVCLVVKRMWWSCGWTILARVDQCLLCFRFFFVRSLDEIHPVI